MQIRASRISASIARAIAVDPSAKGSLLSLILSFFSIFRLHLTRHRPADFLALRRDAWELDEEEYTKSFEESRRAGRSRGRLGKKGKGKDEGGEEELVAVGDLGYSGSTFFTTANGKYLVKSLPRSFEHEFFTKDLFDAYVAHNKNQPHSLLVRITDLARAGRASLGGILGTAPTHHIVMENLMFGRDAEEDEDLKKDWETYDLKPSDYFFPERDIADGKLAPESVKDKLVDEFPGKILVGESQKKELLDLLGEDTKLLADHSAVDYSLFLIRYPGPRARGSTNTVPSIAGNSDEWRRGIDDAEGQWTYRCVVLDFFWAKSKLRAKAMTGLVDAFNVLAAKGPMSITAEPGEYRERFLKMVDEMVVGVAG